MTSLKTGTWIIHITDGNWKLEDELAYQVLTVTLRIEMKLMPWSVSSPHAPSYSHSQILRAVSEKDIAQK